MRCTSHLVATLVAALYIVPASASPPQLLWDSREEDVPIGSYLDSCRSQHVRRDVLHADCRDYRGSYKSASLSLRGCWGDVVNRGGRLYCGARADFRSRFDENTGIPSGSYQESCRSAHVRRGVLHADCRSSRGAYRSASVSLRGCWGDIMNYRGRLYCER
jgi:hypothetical protein